MDRGLNVGTGLRVDVASLATAIRGGARGTSRAFASAMSRAIEFGNVVFGALASRIVAYCAATIARYANSHRAAFGRGVFLKRRSVGAGLQKQSRRPERYAVYSVSIKRMYDDDQSAVGIECCDRRVRMILKVSCSRVRSSRNVPPLEDMSGCTRASSPKAW